MSIIMNYDVSDIEKMQGLAENILAFLKDRSHRWTFDLSCHKGGKRGAANTVMTNKKRGMTRPLFYSTVGAGSPLDAVFMKYLVFYTSSTIGIPTEQIKGDHINPPQEFGEFFLDTLHGYFTKKDINILDVDVIVACLKFTMKKVKIKGTINNPLSHYTPSTGKEPIVVSEKYQYLNEHGDYRFKDELTLYTDGRLATEDELQFLFNDCPIDGYSEWQMEKYGAKSYGYFSDDKVETIMPLQNVATLENFF